MGYTKGHSLALSLLGMVSGQPCLIMADLKVLWFLTSILYDCTTQPTLSHNSNRGQR